MINYLREYFFYKNKVKILSNLKNRYKKVNKNKKDTFYIIKRDRWNGMFSNIHFVILHIIYAKSKKYIPIIDMKYYPTIYNEKKKINGTLNSWLYYLNQPNKLELDEIYKKKNYILSNEKNINTSKINSKIYKEYQSVLYNFKFKPRIPRLVSSYEKRYFKNKKILGIHFRGTDQKTAARHPFPPTAKQITKIAEDIFLKKKYDIIFLVTEEIKYYKIFKKIFKDKLISFNSFRSDNNFKVYPRRQHRYLLGLETIINMILLSKSNLLLHSNSNLSAMAKHYSKKKMKEVIIFNGINSSNIFISNFLWYLKCFLPYKFFGFKNKIIEK